MNPFAEFGLSLIGQDPKSQLRGDTDRYDPSTRTIKREGPEHFFDTLFGRGEAIQKAAQDRHVTQLKDSDAYKILTRTSGGVEPEVTAGTSLSSLEGKAHKAQREENIDIISENPLIKSQLEQAQVQTGLLQSAETRAIQEAAEGKRRFDIQMQALHNDREAARLDRASQRESDAALALAQLDVTKQGQENQLSMYEMKLAAEQKAAKRERMAAIMASLANLGAAFAI